MKHCKMSYCKEPVDPKARKQHCTKHMLEYNAKRAEWNRVQATLPDCMGWKFGYKCDNKVPPNKLDYCNDCQKLVDRQDEEQRERDHKAELLRLKLRALDECDDLDDLKSWLCDLVEEGKL